jgi:hypothetical protein
MVPLAVGRGKDGLGPPLVGGALRAAWVMPRAGGVACGPWRRRPWRRRGCGAVSLGNTASRVCDAVGLDNYVVLGDAVRLGR